MAESLKPVAALYLRLSKDDGTAQESESIASQRALLLRYADTHGFQVAEIFSDDGYSGTLRHRPALDRMLLAAQQGKFSVILTKDLSRLSRDYIYTGQLLEQWLPAHGIRYIAVTDGIDTAQGTAANDFMPLRAVMNDWYARDISRKVRSALYARQQKGICTIATIPFGYRRKGDTLIPCPPLVPIIQQIYTEAIQGISLRQIAAKLTESNIPTPRMLQTNSTIPHPWNDVTVRRILQNPIYMGKLMLHRTERISYKCKQIRYLPEDRQCSTEVTPMISKEMFEAAAAALERRKRTPPCRHWLAGLTVCGECGCTMTLRDTTSPHTRLQCSGRRQGNGCTNPSMRAAQAEALLQQQFLSDGLPRDTLLWRRLIAELRIYRDRLELSVIYHI